MKGEFSKRVVKAVLSIPKGRVSTYGRISRACGGGGMAAQSITTILSKATKEGIKIPFHRVVYADGKIWVDDARRKERLALYKKEGIEIDKNDRIKNFQKLLFEFE